MEELTDANTLLDLMRPSEGISPVEHLLNEFEAHEAAEEKALEYYRKALDSMPNPMTRFLLQLIVSDEERHRAVLHAMAATLRGALTWTKPAGSLEGTADTGAINDRLHEVTDEFIAMEKQSIKEYKALMAESGGYYHGLFKILLDSMVRDSEKHIEILEFLRKTLRDA